MMGTPDFKAFEAYLDTKWDRNTASMSIPKTTSEGYGSNYYLLDTARYKNSNNKQAIRSSYINHLLDVKADAEQDAKNQGIALEPTITVEDLADLILDSPANGDALKDYFGGAFAAPDQNYTVMDSRATNLGKFLETNTHETDLEISRKENKYYAKFVRHHEAAHIMLRLDEPGADFAAAILMLQEHPKSRDMLRTTADGRILGGIKNGQYHYERYGHECHDAIEHALSMSPEEIKAMSLNDIYKKAREFDTISDNNLALGDASPEATVYSALRSKNTITASGINLTEEMNIAANALVPATDSEKSYFIPLMPSTKDTAVNAETARGDFSEGSPENEILGNIVEAAQRLQTRLPAATP